MMSVVAVSALMQGRFSLISGRFSEERLDFLAWSLHSRAKFPKEHDG